MADAVLLNNIATRSLNPAFWSCRLRVNDALKDDPPVVMSDFNLWGNRWIKAPDGSMVLDQDAHSTDAVPDFTSWPEWSVIMDLNSPKFGKVHGLGLESDSPGQADGCWVEVVLHDLVEKSPRRLWCDTLAPLISKAVVDVGAR